MALQGGKTMKIKIACPLNSFRGAFMRDRWEITGLVLAFLPGLMLAAPVVGYLWALLGLSFGWIAWTLILFVAVQIALHIREHFKIVSWSELLGLAILLIGIVIVYVPALLTLEPGSSASAVWYKALNLTDGGHLYRAMPWLSNWVGAGVAPLSAYEQYGALVSGAQYTFGDLHFMGLPGGTWFFAWWAMISRSLLFVGPMLLMLSTGIAVNRLLHQAMPGTNWPTRTLLALLLVAMPVYLWLGRGMSPAAYAVPCYLFALLLLMHGDAKGWFYPAALVALLAIPILCGTDFILPFLAAVLLLTWRRPGWGLGLAVSGALLFYGLTVVEPLWFGQVVGMPIWVRLLFLFTLAFYLIGLLLYRFFSRDTAEKWSRSTWVSILFYAGLLVAVLFLFKKNTSPAGGPVALSGFRSLTMVFSGVVLIAGLAGFPALLKQHKWPLLFRLTVVGLFLSQLIFFRERPIETFYTGLLPYIALILPLLWLSFAMWVKKARGWPRYLVLGALLALTVTQAWHAHQIPGNQGIAADLRAFMRQVKNTGADEDTAIAYDPTMEQTLAPWIWYTGMTPAPILQGGEIGVLDAVTDDWLYITGRTVTASQAAGSIAYAYAPPQKNALPGAPQPSDEPWALLDREDIVANMEGLVFPSITWRAEGLGEAGATHARCVGLSVPVGDNRYLRIEIPPEAAGLLDRGLEVCADGVPLLFFDGNASMGHVYWFRLPQGMASFSAVDMYIDPLKDRAEGDAQSGIRIMSIHLTQRTQ
jgi:hypothetical protein